MEKSLTSTHPYSTKRFTTRFRRDLYCDICKLNRIITLYSRSNPPLSLTHVSPHHLSIQPKNVSRFQHIRSTLRSENLLILPPPFRMIDPINIILDLHNHTSILLDDSRSILDVEKSLCGFEGYGAVLAAAGVYLEGVLVGEDVDGDSGPGRGEGCYGG